MSTEGHTSTVEIIKEDKTLFICYRCNYIFSGHYHYLWHKCDTGVYNRGELTGWIQRQQTGNKR